MTIKINSKLYSRGDSGIVIIYANHHSGIKPIKCQVTKPIMVRFQKEGNWNDISIMWCHFYPSLPSTKKLKHPSTNQSTFVEAVGSNPTCPGTREGLAHLCIGKQASRLLPWLGYCRGLWPSVALPDHNPGAALNSDSTITQRWKGLYGSPSFQRSSSIPLQKKKKRPQDWVAWSR